jgi:hypothetical protein
MATTLTPDLNTPMAELYQKVGILEDARKVPAHLELFVEQSEAVMAKVRGKIAAGEMPEWRGPEFQQLLIDACTRVLCHPIVASNNYLSRFQEGVTVAQARFECQQFSVFALNFDVAQAKLVANAPTEEAYRERLNVLLNEKGIPYKDGFEGDLTGKWDWYTVHFTWMMDMGAGLGLGFEDLGKIWVGTPGAQALAQATFDNYGHIEQNHASGAAFAIENWAANNLWKKWIAGMDKLNATLAAPVNLGYLKYHETEEEHHSQATLDELFEIFMEDWFDAEKFFAGAERMLTDGVQAYYDSQLAELPEKDSNWPTGASSPHQFDIASMPRIQQMAKGA